MFSVASETIEPLRPQHKQTDLLDLTNLLSRHLASEYLSSAQATFVSWFKSLVILHYLVVFQLFFSNLGFSYLQFSRPSYHNLFSGVFFAIYNELGESELCQNQLIYYIFALLDSTLVYSRIL